MTKEKTNYAKDYDSMEFKELFDEVSSKFKYLGPGDTYCWSLSSWTDGYWSIHVVDNWHKWLDKKIPKLDLKYYTPQLALRAFLKHVDINKIKIDELQGEIK